MDAIKLLKQQHRDVAQLFKDFEEASTASEKEDVVMELSDALAAHATIEEKIFYPAAYVGALKDQVLEATEEHLAAKRVIADLLGMSPDDPTYAAKVKVLQEEIEHHVEEEESDLFKKVRKMLSREELDAIGDGMKAMFDELIEQNPRESVPSETDHAAPMA